MLPLPNFSSQQPDHGIAKIGDSRYFYGISSAYLFLLDASPEKATVQAFEVRHPEHPIELEKLFDRLITLVAERNPDFYEVVDGKLVALNRRPAKKASAVVLMGKAEPLDDEESDEEEE